MPGNQTHLAGRPQPEKFSQEYFQPAVQVNYPNDQNYTRIVEIKHANGQKLPSTTIRLNTKNWSAPFEPEVTAKVAKLGVPIYEVAVSYSGRTYAQGKKVDWRDGFGAVRCILKYNLGSSH